MGKRARIAGPDDSDMQRISQVLGTIGGQHVVWGAQATLDVWVAEVRMEAERLAARRVLAATWVLAIATLGLVAATIGLIVATVQA